MTKELPQIPGFAPVVVQKSAPLTPVTMATPTIGHNNPPAETIELEALKALDGPDLFLNGGVAKVISDLSEQAAAFTGDVSTQEGREARKSFAYRLTRSKTILDDKGAELNKPLREKIDAVDKVRRDMKAKIDQMVKDVRAPLDKWESDEQARINGLNQKIKLIRDSMSFFQEPSVKDIDDRLGQLDYLNGVDWQEKSYEAVPLLAEAINSLKLRRVSAEVREAEQAELAKLRAAQAERDAQDKAREAEFMGKPYAETTPQPDRTVDTTVFRSPVSPEQARNARIMFAINNVIHRHKGSAIDQSDTALAKAIASAIIRGQIPNVTITN